MASASTQNLSIIVAYMRVRSLWGIVFTHRWDRSSLPCNSPTSPGLHELVDVAFTGSHKPAGFPWHHGNWCGSGGEGIPIDGLDFACMQHDYCYAHNGLTLGNNYGLPSLDDLGQMKLQNCNESLCRAADRNSGIPDAAWVTRYFTFGVGNAAGCAHY
jgi:hypothetical protein